MTTFATPEPIHADIDLLVGSAHLIATDRNDTVVVVSPSDGSRKSDQEAAEETIVDLANGRLLVKTPKPRGIGSYIGMGRYGSVEITIELPRGSHVDVKTSFGDLRVDGRLGATRVHSGAGDILLDETGPLNLSTGAGSVSVNRAVGHTEVTAAGEMRLGAIDGQAQIKNLNGKTWIGEVTGALRVKSANGDITVDRAHADVGAKTANGHIQIGEVVSGSVELATASGELEIGIRDGTAAWVDAKTQFGRVHNDLGSAEGPELSQQTVEIRARTSFGNIVIHRS